MNIRIHRGTGQIGGTIVEISSFDTKRKKMTGIILDCGRNLPPLDDPKATDNMSIPGLTNGDSRYDAVFVTHHHADHCGLLGRVNNDIPIYMSGITKDVLETVSDFIDSRPLRAVETIAAGNPVTIHNMKITPLEVDHSAKGALMFLVEADSKKVLYTGDFNAISEQTYAELGIEGEINVLLCEGTNIEADNDKSEDFVLSEAVNIMTQKTGSVFVLCSTTNINRIEAIEQACRESGRILAIDPFMKTILGKVGYKLSIDSIGFLPHYIDHGKNPRLDKYIYEKDADPPKIIEGFSGYFETARKSKKSPVTFMIRQSMSSFLRGLKKYKALDDSVLIYSIWTGYKRSAYTKKFLDLCNSLNMDIADLHVSGHAYRDQLKTAIERIHPKILIPVHTENEDAFTGLHNNVKTLDKGEEWPVP